MKNFLLNQNRKVDIIRFLEIRDRKIERDREERKLLPNYVTSQYSYSCLLHLNIF